MRCAIGFESTLGWKLLYREGLREEPVIDAHRYTADVAIHVHIIVTHHGQSFKTPPAYQTVHAKRPPRQRLRSSRLRGDYPFYLPEARFWIVSGSPTVHQFGS